MANHANRMIPSTRGMMLDTRHGWVPKVKPAPAPTAHSEVNYSIAGLGAYFKLRSHPGKQFPSRAITVKLGDKGRQAIHLNRAFSKGTARPFRTSNTPNTHI